jgi:hypothetical protein
VKADRTGREIRERAEPTRNPGPTPGPGGDWRKGGATVRLGPWNVPEPRVRAVARALPVIRRGTGILAVMKTRGLEGRATMMHGFRGTDNLPVVLPPV